MTPPADGVCSERSAWYLSKQPVLQKETWSAHVFDPVSACISPSRSTACKPSSLLLACQSSSITCSISLHLHLSWDSPASLSFPGARCVQRCVLSFAHCEPELTSTRKPPRQRTHPEELRRSRLLDVRADQNNLYGVLERLTATLTLHSKEEYASTGRGPSAQGFSEARCK